MPKIVDHDQYRKQLLSKCFDLFAEKGYASITMRQVAEGLGVSTGTLYHYFPNKKALFEQLVEEITQKDLQFAMDVVEGTHSLSQRLEALGTYLLEKEDYFIKFMCILLDFCQHQERNEIQGSVVLRRVDELLRQTICELLGIQDPRLASFVVCLIDGIIIERLWGNEIVSFPEQFALLGKMLTAYLEKHEVTR
ncbi:TetR/AcrR family transcriptional regulator [Aetokthonos hydrillicola Thurmond2011]|uniref:TetR/AcrR family transcriptional regulator n=1 Tax=Aetokthonos hydrillicola Thurmond2011 TaxID=2712845 RepID=A0AAP5MB67_9CYAN|nr:TetR/AcrR family transcriptional regulator [Aetokthonos hydrillicola]MBO3460392.1 TetR/AcrR family transcriptional regulator [Aetokthonos hydrillicola CCALA 1050]MBW4584486.1 TetR/AcrR family transcriptional regulator [Aetokthonos hydrillicola CCALA 1050]MDR9896449.1 TetR/AcrR family transcriptional regulator [Aetokthonos hydrillicola Thurmond2011]